MSMTAQTLVKTAVGKARHGDGVIVEDLAPNCTRITDKPIGHKLIVYTTASGFPMLDSVGWQVTLPEAQATQLVTAWIDGAALPVKAETAEKDGNALPTPEIQGLFDMLFRAAFDATARWAAADNWPVSSGNDREWTLTGPWEARLTFMARTDETGQLTGASWVGRGADGVSICNHGGVEAALEAARSWAAGLDELPVLTPAGLRARRQALGLSQADLAVVVGASQAAVAQWESGGRAPRDPAQVSTALTKVEDQVSDITQQLIQVAKARSDHDYANVSFLITPASNTIDSGDLLPALHRTATGRAFDQLRRDGYHPIILEAQRVALPPKKN